MARCVDEVELVHLAVLRLIAQGYALRLDRNPTLALEIHRVQYLLSHFTIGKPATVLNKPVRKRRLAVVYVCNDRKITNSVHVGYCLKSV